MNLENVVRCFFVCLFKVVKNKSNFLQYDSHLFMKKASFVFLTNLLFFYYSKPNALKSSLSRPKIVSVILNKYNTLF